MITTAADLIKGARVIVRTVNGGECIAVLAEDYRPSYGICLEKPVGFTFWVAAWRLQSIELAD